MDGKNILDYFDGKVAAEMRLTEAINQKLLSPFQYFCVSDEVDLSKLKWDRKGYEIKELEKVYTANDKRSNQIIHSLIKYVTDLEEVKGLGFCVSIEHAKYMAEYFNNSNIPAVALYGNVNSQIRKEAQANLIRGEIKFIFVVDLYNEGIDIPEVNTILFLRPTESLTVFLQQLGRGLRLSDGKECLTVLDFVGQAHRNYNFEEKFRALIGKTKYSVRHYVENGFFNLPKGSFIQLEKQAKEYILRNIKSSTLTKANLVNRIKYFTQDTGLELTLNHFLKHHQLSLYEVYGKNKDRTFYQLRVEAGLTENKEFPSDKLFKSRLPNLFHINSRQLLTFFIEYLNKGMVDGQKEKLMLGMLYYTFYQEYPEKLGFTSMEEGLQRIFEINEYKKEILEILQYLYISQDVIEKENDFSFLCPLGVHSKYTTNQILAGLDYYNETKSPSFREGAKHLKDKNLDIFFITLNKSEKDFSPSTLYDDYAINETLFHWQSQSKVTETSETAIRYKTHRQTGHQIALFVREYKKENGYTSPFVFLGTADYIKSEGSKPVSFTWKLREEMPAWLVKRALKGIV